MTLLVVTAVAAERSAVLAGARDIDVSVVGVGPAAAAAGTARLLALAETGGTPYRWVISAGIAGGLPGYAAAGTVVIGTRSIAADLGADSPDGFVALDELATTAFTPDPRLLASLRTALPDACAGPILTVSTVTGTASGLSNLVGRYPDAVAEAMEGYGVAYAASLWGVGFAEVRTVSNPVGPRDRAAWRLADALAALTAAAPALRSPV